MIELPKCIALFGASFRKLFEDIACDAKPGQMLFADDLPALLALLQSTYPACLICEESSFLQDKALMAKVAELSPSTSVVFVSNEPKMSVAVGLLRSGACDYVQGPLGKLDLQRVLSNLACNAPLRNLDMFFLPLCPPEVPFAGKSNAAKEVLQTLSVVAASRCNPVLITGPTGTGKELAARTVHCMRHGSGAKFVAINCAALTASLLESELFGHVRGSFTGADREKTGLLEFANGGTLFLDEISEMAIDLQAKLLRVLQERVFRKVGGTTNIACDATIIASSNRDLLDEVSKGGFRQDLYYRLAIFPIQLPALSDPDRCGDIELLAQYFMATSKIADHAGAITLSQGARTKLLQHDWPGNIRELKNVIERALIINLAQEIAPSSIIIINKSTAAARPTPCEDFSLESAEREFIIRALKEANWQRTRAASLLGITRATLHAKIKRYDLMPVSVASDYEDCKETDLSRANS